MSTESDQSARVLLIHGTGAGSPQSSGQAWWQRGSDFWNDLNKRLHPRAGCWPDEEAKHVFHWGSGPNRETERLKAGRELLEQWLIPLEREGQPYHLIGHSHGGSVIWNALLDATRRGENLKGLGSWTTLGTPFLHYRAERLGLWELLAVPLSAPVFLWLAWMAHIDLPYDWRSIWERPGLGLFVIVAGLLLGYSLYRLIVILRAWHRVRSDASWAGKAFARYGPRWLGLYSELDEAKNGLRATLNRSDRIVPRIPKWSESIVPATVPSFLVWLYNLIAVPYYFLARPFYNRWIAPEVDAFINKRLANICQGNDRSGYALLRVHTGPILASSAQQIKPEIEQRLREQADAGLAKLLSSARGRLGVLPAESSTLQQFLGEVVGDFTGTELIHTSYYRDGDMRVQLATYIGGGGGPGTAAAIADAGLVTKTRKQFPLDTDWRRLYFSGLLFLFLPLGLWLLAPVPWYLCLSQEEYRLLGAKTMKSNHPMLRAIGKDDVRALRYFLDHQGANREAKPKLQPHTLLAEAISTGRLRTVEYLFDKRKFHQRVPDLEGLPPLHRAAQAGEYEVARLLLDLGAEVNERDKADEKNTPLHWAVRSGEDKIVGLLVDREADVNALDHYENLPVELLKRPNEPIPEGSGTQKSDPGFARFKEPSRSTGAL